MFFENFAAPLFLTLSLLAFSCRRLVFLLHSFQQEEYDNSRFLRHVLSGRLFDKRLSALILVLALLCGLLLNIKEHSMMLTTIGFGLFGPRRGAHVDSQFDAVSAEQSQWWDDSRLRPFDTSFHGLHGNAQYRRGIQRNMAGKKAQALDTHV